MVTSSRVVRSWIVLCSVVLAAGALVQAQQGQQGQFQPTPGQPGKDVIWLPTAQSLVDRMLDLGQVTPQDFVIDLGSGDGRTVITAAKRGARALGIEYNPDMVELSKQHAAAAGVADRAAFEKADLFETDFSKATLITMFLLPDINLKLRPKLLDLRPGTRIVSNSFTMGDWMADDSVTATEECTSYCTAYLWIVPAKVAGTYTFPQGELTLTQAYQAVSGTLANSGGGASPITGGRLKGDQLSFSVGNTQFTGRVSGNTIEGTAKANGMTARWTATRVAK